MNTCPECGAKLDFIESSRVMLKQDPMKEGIIELRKGVDEITLGERHYAQVRIRVGNAQNYIRGMAVYSEEIPDGYDIIFYIGNELDEHGRIRGLGTDLDQKYKKPLTIIETEGAWEAWTNSVNLPRKKNRLPNAE